MDRLLEFSANHPLLVTATIVMLVAVLVFELRLRARAGFEVTVLEAVQMINRGADVVDVRPAGEFAAGHIVDALNMPADELAKGEEGRLKKKRGLLVVCETGGDSHRCARLLQARGFDAAFSLRGGLAAWRRDNQPLVAGKARGSG